MNTFQSVSRLAGFLLLALVSNAVLAAAGTVTHLSGTLYAQRADGSVRILSQRSEVNQGDVLTTQRDSYAQVGFTDGSSMTLRPETQIRIDQYNFVQDRPQEDNSFLRLIKGGLRTVTGLVGKRGNQDAYKIGTNTATIGIRGSSGVTMVVTGPPERQNTAHLTNNGIYIMTSHKGQQLLIAEGQVGRVTPDGRVEFTTDVLLRQELGRPEVFRISGVPVVQDDQGNINRENAKCQ